MPGQKQQPEQQQQKIRVTCPSCFKRFEVSAKFAGREGPCPSCQKPIRIPTLDEQVKLHEREGFGGVKSASGKLVFKPVAREDAQFSPLVLGISLTVVLVSLIVTYFIGRSFEPHELTFVTAAGSVLFAIPVCWSGYWFLRDPEFEGFEGGELWTRVVVCSLAFAAIWGVYALLVSYWDLSPNLNEYLPYYVGLAVICSLGGAFAATGAFEIPPLSGFLMYAFYLSVTLVLRMVLGVSAYYVYW